MLNKRFTNQEVMAAYATNFNQWPNDLNQNLQNLINQGISPYFLCKYLVKPGTIKLGDLATFLKGQNVSMYDLFQAIKLSLYLPGENVLLLASQIGEANAKTLQVIRNLYSLTIMETVTIARTAWNTLPNIDDVVSNFQDMANNGMPMQATQVKPATKQEVPKLPATVDVVSDEEEAIKAASTSIRNIMDFI